MAIGNGEAVTYVMRRCVCTDASLDGGCVNVCNRAISPPFDVIYIVICDKVAIYVKVVVP